MTEHSVKVYVDTSDIEAALDKAKRLVELLKEAQQILKSFSDITTSENR